MKTTITICAVAALSVAAAGLLAAPARAVAQYTNTYTFRQFNNPMSSYMDTRLAQRMQQRRLQERILDRNARSGAPGSAAAPASAPALPRRPISATDFRPVGTRVLLDTMVAATATSTEQRQDLRTLYVEILKTFEQQARKNNVANALAFLLAASTLAASGRELSEAEIEQLARELNDVLASAPEFQRMSARQKQAMYEAAVITGGMIGVVYQLGVEQGNAELKEQARELGRSVIGQVLGGTR